MTSTEMIEHETTSFELVQRQAKMFLQSGYFKNVKDMAQACVKMEIARSVGLHPIQGLMGIHFVQERLTFEASIMAAVAKRAGYEFRAVSHSEAGAKIAVHNKRGDKLGESEFTLADATRAGLTGKDNWKKYPKNMVWARAMANACRWYCSDAFGGPVYTPEELGAEVDETGKPVLVAGITTGDGASDKAQSLTAALTGDLSNGQTLQAVSDQDVDWAAVEAQTKLREKQALLAEQRDELPDFDKLTEEEKEQRRHAVSTQGQLLK